MPKIGNEHVDKAVEEALKKYGKKPEAGKEFTHLMTVDLDALLGVGGMEGLNDMMDDDFHDTYGFKLILTDISYKPVGVDNDNHIVLEVSGLVESID
jgi:hypothetical protein